MYSFKIITIYKYSIKYPSKILILKLWIYLCNLLGKEDQKFNFIQMTFSYTKIYVTNLLLKIP